MLVSHDGWYIKMSNNNINKLKELKKRMKEIVVPITLTSLPSMFIAGAYVMVNKGLEATFWFMFICALIYFLAIGTLVGLEIYKFNRTA